MDKALRFRFLLIMVFVIFCISITACSGVVTSIETDHGEIDFGNPYTFKGDAGKICRLPYRWYRWSDDSDNSTSDYTYIMQIYSRINLVSGGDWFEQENNPSFAFDYDSWDGDLEFRGDCREQEIWLYFDGKKVTSLGKGKIKSLNSMDATRTQVASNIYGTQTELAPAATVTLTPTITNTLLPSLTPTKTPFPTKTSGPTITPGPTFTPRPTPTIDSERIERIKLCYQAAVTVYADLKALYMDDAWLSVYGQIDEDALSALQAERKPRYASLVENIEICILPGTQFEYCHNEDVLSVDGIVLSSEDCLGFEKRIHSCNNFLQVMKRTSGVGMTPHDSAQMQCGNLSAGVQTLEEALLTTYGIDPAELDAMIDPIWQNVHTRYGVAIPGEN